MKHHFTCSLTLQAALVGFATMALLQCSQETEQPRAQPAAQPAERPAEQAQTPTETPSEGEAVPEAPETAPDQAVAPTPSDREFGQQIISSDPATNPVRLS